MLKLNFHRIKSILKKNKNIKYNSEKFFIKIRKPLIVFMCASNDDKPIVFFQRLQNIS